MSNAYGTAYFANLSSARPYYASMEDVRTAVREGSITIGKPAERKTGTLELRKGRWWVVDTPANVVTVERFNDPKYSRPRYRLRHSLRQGYLSDGYTQGSYKLKRDADEAARVANA